MGLTIEFDKKAKKEFSSFSKPIQKQIERFLLKLIETNNPKIYGEVLKGNLESFWRYRVGDYRLICLINEKEKTILILAVGHRKEIYR